MVVHFHQYLVICLLSPPATTEWALSFNPALHITMPWSFLCVLFDCIMYHWVKKNHTTVKCFLHPGSLRRDGGKVWRGGRDECVWQPRRPSGGECLCEGGWGGWCCERVNCCIRRLLNCNQFTSNLFSISSFSVQFRREEDAEKAVMDLNNRWFNGQPIQAELSPVTDFREACCRQYEMGSVLLTLYVILFNNIG